MLKKSAWMGLLLIALLALSVSAAWAAGANRSARAAFRLAGDAAPSKVVGISGGRHFVSPATPDRHGHCFMGEDAAAAFDAY
jgi:hypothetical protein